MTEQYPKRMTVSECHTSASHITYTLTRCDDHIHKGAFVHLKTGHEWQQLDGTWILNL